MGRLDSEHRNQLLIKQLRLHLHRGVGYMAVHGFIKRIDDLVRLTNDGRPFASIVKD